MRHRKKTIKLGRTTAHREALLAGLVCDLIERKRITTTLPKARAVKGFAEKMVTLGKRGTLAARRQAISKLRQKDRVATLFDTIAPTFDGRQGGYTRVVKLGPRSSDHAEMAILEWVDASPKQDAPKKDVAAADKKKPAAKKPSKEADAKAEAKPAKKTKASKKTSSKKKSDD